MRCAPGQMSPNPRSARIVPIALGVAMVAVIVAAGLAPNTGAVPAQGNCEYGSCVAGTGLQWWVLAAIVILVVACLAAALILLRRRRPPPGPLHAPPAVTGPSPGAVGSVTPPPPPPAAAPPAYLETPEDVGTTLPHVPSAGPSIAPVAAAGVAGGAAGAAGGAAAAESEPDIDSLMAELDKISGEILKRPKTATDKKPPTTP